MARQAAWAELVEPERRTSSGLFVFDVLHRLLERRYEDLRVSQVLLGQLKFRDQHTIFVHEH
jgi:hypothetical protein